VIWLVVIPGAAILPIVLAVAYLAWDDRARKERVEKRKRAR
jgi:hypothetical protein